MSETEKTYFVGSDTNSIISALAPMLQSKGVDPSIIAMMNNGGFGGNNWVWIFFLILLYGNNGFGCNGNNIQAQLSNDSGRELLMQAINGNRGAVNDLSTSLGCSVGSIQNTVNDLGSKLAQCCCDNKLLTTQSNYENQIANLNQTNVLGSKIDGNTQSITTAIANQTVEMNNQFCALKERELQNKIDSLTAMNTQLQNSISNANQTQQFAAMIAPLQAEVSSIKQSLPSTVSVPYPQLTAIPTYALNSVYGYNTGQWA